MLNADNHYLFFWGWVHEDSLDALFFECFKSLRARVVELSHLAYLQRSRPKEQHFVSRKIS